MRSPLSPRLLAAFGALILLLAGMGAFALSLMDDLSARIDRLSRDNIPELIATDDAQFALQEFRQAQLRALADPGGEDAARVARRLDLQN